ncbi:MAG: M16 family metallopeptidase, partial [Terriglobales bacterium]
MRVASKYFSVDNRTVGRFIPKQQPMPEMPEPSANGDEHEDEGGDSAHENEKGSRSESSTFSAKDLKKLLAPKSKMTRVKLEQPRKRGASFVSQVRREVLPNGLTVLLMRNPGTESVGITGYIKAGKYFSYKSGSNISEVMADIMPKGSKRFSKTQIAEALEGMGISGALEFALDNYRLSFGSHVVASDLPQYLDLLNDVLRNPLLSEDELSKTKIEWQARYTEASNNPRMLAWNKLRREIYPENHLFFEKMYDEQIAELQALTPDALHAMHKKLLGPKSSIITIVGDVDLDEALKLITDKLGDWKGADPGSIEVPTVALPKAKQRYNVFVADKKSADIVIAHPASLRRSDSDYY